MYHFLLYIVRYFILPVLLEFFKKNDFAKKPKARKVKKSLQPSVKRQNVDFDENKVNVLNKMKSNVFFIQYHGI